MILHKGSEEKRTKEKVCGGWSQNNTQKKGKRYTKIELYMRVSE